MFREMRRTKQQLNHEECIRILTEEKRGVLAVQGDDGYPYALPMNFYYEDGKLYFHGAAAGHKHDAIERSDKASFCVISPDHKEEGKWYWHVNSVIAFGRMSVVPEDEKEEICRKLGNKYYPSPEEVEAEIARDGKRVHCLVLTIEHMSGKHVKEN